MHRREAIEMTRSIVVALVAVLLALTQSPTDFFHLTFGTFFRLSFAKEGPIAGFDAELNDQKASAERID
jgi:hypothetical protein